VTMAAFSLMVTIFSESVALKFVPVIVTSVVLGPSVGLIPVTSGGAVLDSFSSEHEMIKNAQIDITNTTRALVKEEGVFINRNGFEIKV